MKHYNLDFRLQICELILSGQMTAVEAQSHYDLKISTVYFWLKKYGGQQSSEPMSDKPQEDPKVLAARIKALEQQLELERIRNFGLNKMIDIAEEQFDIPIRKKPSTKQSKK